MRNAVLVKIQEGKFPWLYDFVQDGETLVQAKRRGDAVKAKLMPWSCYEKTVREFYLSLPVDVVSEEYYEEQINVLPPLGWKRKGSLEWFFMREFNFATWTEQVLYNRENGNVYVATVDYMDSTTWIQNRVKF